MVFCDMVFFQGEELSVRFKLKNSNVSLMLPRESLKPIKRKFLKACHLSTDQKVQSVFCANCRIFLAKLNIQRYLPLPSMDWRGGIQDWFCACNHGVKANCTSNDKVAQWVIFF